MAGAQIFDPMARLSHAHAATAARSRSGADVYLPMMLRVNPSDHDRLRQLGVVIYCHRGDLAAVAVPADRLEELGGVVRRACGARRASATLDRALEATGAAGLAHPKLPDISLSGKGVVVGFADIGFDANHAVFGDRVERWVHFNDTLATVDVADTRADITASTTDTDEQYHATHVGGILAGDGDGTPYRGVASEATIVATTSLLYDTGVVAGVEEVIAYAARHSMPAVVNLSLGQTLGPHDGTELVCRYLDLCAAEIPVLLAAGNDGDSRISVGHTFTDADPMCRIAVSDRVKWDYMTLEGFIDLWGGDDSPFEARVCVLDAVEHRWIYRSEPIGDEFELDAATDTVFGKAFTGSIMAASEINPENNRRNTLMQLDLHCNAQSNLGPWARYYLAIEVSGASGARLDAYADGHKLALKPTVGTGEVFKEPTDAGSISSLACGYNTIAVGAVTTADETPLLDGGKSVWHPFVEEGRAAPFSSYGATADGRRLPHFAAPGAFVVSAVNRWMVEKYPSFKKQLAAEGATPGHYFAAECGTSMATPHAAGIFALWLEADPTLTPRRLRDIAIATARLYGPADTRLGAGLIDASAGLRMIASAEATAVPEVPAEYFTLQGVPVDNPTVPGIYICRRGQSVEKTVVR